MVSIVVVNVLFLLLISLSNADVGVNSRFDNYASCAKICSCSFDDLGKVLAKCSLAGLNMTGKELQLPPDIYTL